ncbi:MAG: ABC transporter permease [Lachnospiraceae bacterium]|nr:ABC transporter permease [Lachnospiraceae bacterium]
MFSRIFKYRILTLLHSNDNIFWLLLFPILLSVLFNLALKDTMTGEAFENIPIAVIDDENFRNEVVMKSILETVSVTDEAAADEKTMFTVRYVGTTEAEELLETGKIDGYIYFLQGSHLVIRENGISQTIIKTFLDITEQKKDIYQTMLENNNGSISWELMESLSESKEYILDVSNGRDKADTSLPFFYSILGMACLYSASIGCLGLSNIQINQSPVAKRNCMAPVKKIKLMLSDFAAYGVLCNIIILIIFLFISEVIGIDFGNRYGLILLTSLTGSYTGLSFGYFIGAVVKSNMNIKFYLVTAVSMLWSFMAGMMSNTIKYMINQHVWILNRLNPVNLITESYYKLYYYKDLDKYYENMIILLGMIIFFLAGTALVLRYQEQNIVRKGRKEVAA